jgi:hypothetical protein
MYASLAAEGWARLCLHSVFHALSVIGRRPVNMSIVAQKKGGGAFKLAFKTISLFLFLKVQAILIKFPQFMETISQNNTGGIFRKKQRYTLQLPVSEKSIFSKTGKL